MLTLQVKEKQIENLTPEEEFIRGTVGAECQINLDEFWQGYENTVVFKRENDCTVYNVVIDSLSNRVEIPYTILAESGSFKVGLFGVKPDEVLPTLWSDYIKVRYGTDTHGTTPPKYEPNEIDQLRLSKQDKLTVGDGITIDENNVISAQSEEVDQNYNANSLNAQSGKAVAEALATIPEITVDQTYNSESENAQSGKAVAEAVNTKQDILVDGTNIKTVNNESLLGEGNITIETPQPDWNQNDPTQPDYIKNRTHYATKAFEDITWDGDKTDHVMFDLGDGIQYFKVSDRTPSIDELIGGTFTINTPDGEMDFPENLDESFIAEIQGALDIAEENVLIINIDVFVEEVLGFTFDNATNGIYFLYNTVEDTYTSKLVSGEKVVKKINEKYLPDISIVAKTGNYNDLKNKPEIDQTYNEGSNNAQSGKAVAQAINKRSVGFSFNEIYKPMSKIKVIPKETSFSYLTYPKDEDYIVKYIHDNKDIVPLDDAKNCIAARDGKGNLWTGTPIDNVDCVNKKYLEEALQNVTIDATTTPTADKIPKYNQYGQLIVNCTEYEPGTEKAKVYSGESVPRDLWKAYINNFHQRITNLDNRTTGIDSLFDKKISFQYVTTDTEVTLKSNCLYLVIDHSGSNNTNVYVTKSDDTKTVATTQGDSAVENFPAFRLSLIFVPHDHNHTIVIGQTGKFSLTNFSPLYTKQVIWDSTYKNMFIKTTGTGMSVWEVNI